MSTSDNNMSGRKGRGQDKVLHQAQPYSLQAERAIIGAAIEDPELAFTQLAGSLLSEHFYDPFCRLAFEKFIELVQEGNRPDAVLLAASMDGFVSLSVEQIQEELEAIYETFPSASNVTGWMSVVQDRFLQRRIDGTGERLREIAHAQDLAPEQKISQAMGLLNDAAASVSRQETVTTQDMVLHTLAHLQRRAEDPDGDSGSLSYGFEELDQRTTGMHGSELIVVAARPGMGKTAMALAIAKATAAHHRLERRKRVLMYSLEMSPEQMGMRWLADICDVPVSKMREGTVSPEQWQRLQDSVESAGDYPFEIDKKAAVTVEQICSDSRKIHRERGLALVIVDYLQLVTVSGGSAGANRAELVGHISRSLKSLSRELGIPVIALSQLNRDLEKRADKRPMMSDLRESGSIEQDADVIMFLYRDEYYTKSACKEPGVAEVIIAKQRQGEANITVTLGWDGPRTRFYTLPNYEMPNTARSVARAFEGATPF